MSHRVGQENIRITCFSPTVPEVCHILL